MHLCSMETCCDLTAQAQASLTSHDYQDQLARSDLEDLDYLGCSDLAVVTIAICWTSTCKIATSEKSVDAKLERIEQYSALS